MSLIEIHSQNELNELEGKILVDFSAVWCGPCKLMIPKLKKIAKDFPDLTVCKIDADECQSIMSDFDINAVPTFVFIDENGLEVHRIEGADHNGLLKFCKKFVV